MICLCGRCGEDLADEKDGWVEQETNCAKCSKDEMNNCTDWLGATDIFGNPNIFGRTPGLSLFAAGEVRELFKRHNLCKTERGPWIAMPKSTDDQTEPSLDKEPVPSEVAVPSEDEYSWDTTSFY